MLSKYLTNIATLKYYEYCSLVAKKALILFEISAFTLILVVNGLSLGKQNHIFKIQHTYPQNMLPKVLAGTRSSAKSGFKECQVCIVET